MTIHIVRVHAAVLSCIALTNTVWAVAQEPGASAMPPCNLRRGEQVFVKCAICHAKDEVHPSPAGPHLYGVVGRKSAALPDFKYSKAMLSLRQTWTADLLDRFLVNPAAMVPGTTMAFTGLKSERDRAAVICLLKSASAGAFEY